jgi:glucokinase
MISRILQLLLIDIVSVGISVDAQNTSDPAVRERRLLISHLDG